MASGGDPGEVPACDEQGAGADGRGTSWRGACTVSRWVGRLAPTWAVPARTFNDHFIEGIVRAVKPSSDQPGVDCDAFVDRPSHQWQLRPGRPLVRGPLPSSSHVAGSEYDHCSNYTQLRRSRLRGRCPVGVGSATIQACGGTVKVMIRVGEPEGASRAGARPDALGTVGGTTSSAQPRSIGSGQQRNSVE